MCGYLPHLKSKQIDVLCVLFDPLYYTCMLFDKCNLRKMFCLFQNVFVVYIMRKYNEVFIEIDSEIVENFELN